MEFLIHTQQVLLFSDLDDDRFLCFPDSCPGKSVLRTDLYAFAAADTFSAVGIFHRVYTHLTLAGTGAAVNTGALIKAHAENADLLEQGIEGTQRADILTEWTVNKNRSCHAKDQQDKFPAEKCPGCRTHTAVQKDQRNPAFQCADRADKFTDPRHADIDLIAVKE